MPTRPRPPTPKPPRTAKPAGTAKSADRARPAGAAKSADGARPAGTAKSADRAKSAGVSKSAGAAEAPARGAGKRASKPAGAAKAAGPPKSARPAEPTEAAAAAGPARSQHVPGSQQAPGSRTVRPRVQRTCYEVRLMVCPRTPAACPETWPVGQRLLCGSFEMLARFEKASGGDDLESPEAGLADALGDLSIRNRLDADPDDQAEETEDDDTEGEEG